MHVKVKSHSKSQIRIPIQNPKSYLISTSTILSFRLGFEATVSMADDALNDVPEIAPFDPMKKKRRGDEDPVDGSDGAW